MSNWTERVNAIKNATVKVEVEGINSSGTGFFIHHTGVLVTCFHVIDAAFFFGEAQRQTPLKIYVTDNNGIKSEYRLLGMHEDDANKFDYALLQPKEKKENQPYLKFSPPTTVVEEGMEVYTSGYPLSVQSQFCSKGIISSKYVAKRRYSLKGVLSEYDREELLLDLTLNPGNSGGAIVLAGNTPKDDVVIGIADFIINPISGIYDTLRSVLQKNPADVVSGNVSQKDLQILFADMLAKGSVGIGGCIPVRYIREFMIKNGMMKAGDAR